MAAGGSFPAGSSSRGLKLTIHFHLVRRKRISRAIPLLPHTPLRRVYGQLYLYFSWNNSASFVGYYLKGGNEVIWKNPVHQNCHMDCPRLKSSLKRWKPVEWSQQTWHGLSAVNFLLQRTYPHGSLYRRKMHSVGRTVILMNWRGLSGHCGCAIDWIVIPKKLHFFVKSLKSCVEK
jgi:hypothetical protein